MKKKWISLLLCFCMITLLSSAFSEGVIAGEQAGHQIEEKTLPIYVMREETDLEGVFYFLDGEEGIAWVDLESWLPIYQKLLGAGDSALTITGEADKEAYTLTRENGAAMEVDFEKDTISFNDYNLFTSQTAAAALVDRLSIKTVDEEGKPYLFLREPEKSFDRPGDITVYDLASYGIHLVHQDGKYLVPLNTIVDLALMIKDGICVLYNGQAVFFIRGDTPLGTQDELSPLGEIYYSAESRDRTEAEIEYGYAELCLMMDNFYGLKEIHQISSFDELFHSTGLDESLKSPDAGIADIALEAVIELFLDDLHSSFKMHSWMVPEDSEHELLRTSRTGAKMSAAITPLAYTRLEYYPDGAPGYEEVGNTAFITFNSFLASVAQSLDMYELTEEEIEQYSAADTIALIIYANRQITREDSPIENVVLDLSMNPGGSIDAAIFVLAWFLGDGDIAFQDKNSGALSAIAYKADVNLDREFDEKDVLTGKNLYCLISPYGFSCGNLVPAVLKDSQRVTLIGRQTSGGTSTVQYAASPWGTYFQMSSPIVMSVLKNGSLYDIDKGVAPDYYLSKNSSFYDRTKLVDIINNMD